MPKNEFDRLFDRLDSLTVGFGPMFRQFQTEVSGYPPHNIIQQDGTNFVLELAIAGFKKSEITIQVLNGDLVIKGVKSDAQDDSYQYRGIGKRSFEKSFKLAEHIEVIDAKSEDGMLSIYLMKVFPDAEKPRQIIIN